MTVDSQSDYQERIDESFVQLLTAEQLRLLHYIAMLLGDVNEANNVLQETNLVLWRKADEFQPGTNFSAWARKTAYWQVQAFVRDRGRDRLVFDEHLICQLASLESSDGVESETRVALRHCLAKVSATSMDMIRSRYEAGMSIKALAKKLGKSQSAIKVGLLRIRRALLRCIQEQLSKA